jgi:hypothetical protein
VDSGKVRWRRMIEKRGNGKKIGGVDITLLSQIKQLRKERPQPTILLVKKACYADKSHPSSVPRMP